MPADPEPSVLDRSWTLVAGHGPDGPVTMAAGHPITLEIEGDRWAGSAGCNRYTTTVARDGEHVTIPHAIATTLMACLDDVMAAEGVYVAALPRIESVELTADQLTLHGRDVQFVFEPTPTSAVDDAPVHPRLVGTDWVIVALVDDAPTASERPVVGAPRLHLAEDGSIGGHTGCNRFTGRYELEGSRLTIGPLATTRMACDEAAATQEAFLLRVLSDATVGTAVNGDTLRLTGPAGAAIELRVVATGA
jgi:heat shock protein HslJ